jgi:hypothetical protein
LISLDTTAIVPAIRVVRPPNHSITSNMIGVYSSMKHDLNNKYIPAHTRQAACSSDDTGVGYIYMYIYGLCLVYPDSWVIQDLSWYVDIWIYSLLG